jgi:hypothetical protein
MEVRAAYSYAEELGILKFFPSNGAAVAKIAELIADLCVDESQARVLVDLMCKRFDEWPGPVTLQAIHAERFGTKHPPEWKPSWEENCSYPTLCVTCEDQGYFKNSQNVYERCTCETSKSISDQMIRDFNNWKRMRQMPEGETIVRRKERVH